MRPTLIAYSIVLPFHIPNLHNQSLDFLAQDVIGKNGDTNNRCHTFNVLWVSVCIEGNAAEFISEQEIMFLKE